MTPVSQHLVAHTQTNKSQNKASKISFKPHCKPRKSCHHFGQYWEPANTVKSSDKELTTLKKMSWTILKEHKLVTLLTTLPWFTVRSHYHFLTVRPSFLNCFTFCNLVLFEVYTTWHIVISFDQYNPLFDINLTEIILIMI